MRDFQSARIGKLGAVLQRFSDFGDSVESETGAIALHAMANCRDPCKIQILYGHSDLLGVSASIVQIIWN